MHAAANAEPTCRPAGEEPVCNLSLAAGIAANAVYLAYDPPWVKSLGDLVTTGIQLATAIRIWQVFPFSLSSGWSTAVRILLVVAIAGSCIALVVQTARPLRQLPRSRRQRSLDGAN